RHGVRGRGATRTACPASGAHADRLRAAGREGDGGGIEFVAAVDGAPELDAMSMAIETELRGEQCRCAHRHLQQLGVRCVDGDGGEPPIMAIHGSVVLASQEAVQRSAPVLGEQDPEPFLWGPHLSARHRAAVGQPQPAEAPPAAAGASRTRLEGCQPRATASWVNEVNWGAFVNRGSTTTGGPPAPERICCCSRSIASAARTVARATPNSAARRRSEGRTAEGSLPAM